MEFSKNADLIFFLKIFILFRTAALSVRTLVREGGTSCELQKIFRNIFWNKIEKNFLKWSHLWFFQCHTLSMPLCHVHTAKIRNIVAPACWQGRLIIATRASNFSEWSLSMTDTVKFGKISSPALVSCMKPFHVGVRNK